MKVLWICGLPNEVRVGGWIRAVSPVRTAAWSWVLGHLPPPPDIELNIVCPVVGQTEARIDFIWNGASWHCLRQDRNEQAIFWRRMYRRMKTVVDEIRPDVIHGWGGETGCGYLATLLAPNAVVSVQGLLQGLMLLYKRSNQSVSYAIKAKFHAWINRMIERRTYAKARILLTESFYSHDSLKEYYHHDSCVVCHPLRSVFLEDYDNAMQREDNRIIYVGEFVWRKGVCDAVRAFIEAGIPEAKLILIGHGCQESEVRELINSKGISGRVQMLPECSSEELQAEMRRAEIFILPSYSDTGPTALKEAISQGCIPVCYNNTGPKELIGRYGGFVAETGNVADLADKLRMAIMSAKEKRECVDAAAQRIRMDLSPCNIWNCLKKVYASI